MNKIVLRDEHDKTGFRTWINPQSLTLLNSTPYLEKDLCSIYYHGVMFLFFGQDES
jgi:hypothetical protein